MPIFNTLEEALNAQPTMRRSLFHHTEKIPTPSRSSSSTSLEKQYRKATMPLNLPRPVINRNYCGGSGSIHALSPLLEGDTKESMQAMEAIELDELVPADEGENGGKKVRVDEKMEVEERKEKERNGEVKEGRRQSWMLKCAGK